MSESNAATTMQLELQNASTEVSVPSEEEFHRWVQAIIGNRDFAMVIRVVDEAESSDFNFRYRNNTGPTNVLSFPFEAPPGMGSNILGDLVVCAPVIAREANEQSKSAESHWAHIVIHGVLHLLGYDHVNEVDAIEMEEKEIGILRDLGIRNPYEVLDL